MLTFTYQAKNAKTGEKVKAQVQADNEQEAAKLIQNQGLTPINISVERGALGIHLNRIKTKDKVLFARQLSTLINAGLPLVQSLRNVVGQTQNKNFQVIINQVITDVESGTAFSAALAKFPDTFNAIFVNLVAAGEVSGTLDVSLARLADQ